MLKKKDSSAVSQSSEPDRNNIKASGNKSRHLDSGQPLGTALGEITEGGEREGWSGINGILYILFSQCIKVCICVCVCVHTHVPLWASG